MIWVWSILKKWNLHRVYYTLLLFFQTFILIISSYSNAWSIHSLSFSLGQFFKSTSSPKMGESSIIILCLFNKIKKKWKKERISPTSFVQLRKHQLLRERRKKNYVCFPTKQCITLKPMMMLALVVMIQFSWNFNFFCTFCVKKTFHFFWISFSTWLSLSNYSFNVESLNCSGIGWIFNLSLKFHLQRKWKWPEW